MGLHLVCINAFTLITWFFQVGKANGLTLLLDAETYEYSSHAAGAEGFKVAVDHHLDQPLMSINELDIAPGFESQGGGERNRLCRS